MDAHGSAHPTEKAPWEKKRPKEVEMFWLLPLLAIVIGGLITWFVIYDLNNGQPTIGPMVMLLILGILVAAAIFLTVVGIARLFGKKFIQAVIYIVVAVVFALVAAWVVWPIVSAPR